MTLCLSLKLKYYSNGLTMQNTSALSERTFPSKERIHSYLKSTRYTPTLIETASIYRGSVFFCLVWSVRAGVYKSANVKDKYICYFQKVIGVREVVVFCYMMLFINCSITFTQCNILLKHSAALLVHKAGLLWDLPLNIQCRFTLVFSLKRPLWWRYLGSFTICNVRVHKNASIIIDFHACKNACNKQNC